MFLFLLLPLPKAGVKDHLGGLGVGVVISELNGA